MSSTPKPKKFMKRFSFWFVIVVVIVAAGLNYARMSVTNETNAFQSQSTYEVQEGPLTISVAVSGTIQAREKVILKSELEGSNAILYIIPEGKKVKKGDLLVELDASALADELIDQQISVQNAEASFINSRENYEIVKNQAQSDIDEAILLFDFAKQDLKKYTEGEFPKLQKEAEAQITLNEEELSRAEDDLKWSQILYEEKYISQSELRQDEILAQRSQLNLELAKDDLELLNDFTYKRQLAALESDVKQSEMALERTRRKAAANIVQASAELQAKESELNRQISKLQKIEDQLQKARIIAPMDGVAVHATSVRQSFRGNDEPLQEGTAVRERQELIHLPTTSSYIAEVKVHESSLEKIRLGQPVRITIDALPDKVLVGQVATIAPLPDAQSVFMNPDLKVYKTEIYIQGDGEDLRSGMSCRAEIIIDQFKNTTYIPVQAVVRVNGDTLVYVAKGNEWEKRVVTLGPDNNRLAQIESGLNKGEVVWLTPPLGASQMNMGGQPITEEFDMENFEAEEIAPITGSGRANRFGADAPAPGGAMGAGMQGAGMQGAGMQGAGRTGAPGGMPNMTDEQREEMRKRFESMSPDERQAAMQRFRGQGGAEGGPRGTGGQRGERGVRGGEGRRSNQQPGGDQE
jgi:HlyD family secretion protein